MANKEQLMTINDALLFFGCSRPTLRAWRKKKLIKEYQKGRRIYIIMPENGNNKIGNYVIPKK